MSRMDYLLELHLIGEKPIILVNLEAARAEGANFSAQFLKLVEIIK